MSEAIATAENKGNLLKYYNDCDSCRRNGGMTGDKPPTVVYQAPKNVEQGKVVRDEASVGTIQKFLNQSGADGKAPKDSVKENGQWGTGTSVAFYKRMVEIQEKNGIKPDGAPNKETLEAMRKNGLGKEADALDKMKKEGILDRVYNSKLAKVICEGNDAAKPAQTAPVAPKADTAKPHNALGIADNDFKRLDEIQNEMNRTLGVVPKYTQGDAAGQEGRQALHDRVQKFQKETGGGLPQDGNIDPKTLEAMGKSNDPAMRKIAELQKEGIDILKRNFPADGKTPLAANTPDKPFAAGAGGVILDGVARSTDAPGQTMNIPTRPGDAAPKTVLTGADVVKRGDINYAGGTPLTRTFAQADANPGPTALDQKQPSVSRDTFVVQAKQQNNFA